MGRHDRVVLQSVDLDTDASITSQLDEDYDAGWPSSTPGLWSAKGPTIHAPRMSLARSAKLHARWAYGGWTDANRWKRAIGLVQMSSELRMGLLKGLLLSTAVCALVYFFRLTMLPSRTWYDEADSFENEDTSAVWVGSVSSAFWLYPLIAGSYLMASTWTTGVAEAAYSAQNVKVAGIRQRLQATTWVEHVCRLALIVNYSVVCFGLQCIPYLGPPLAFLVMSMVDGYFCFEQIWAVRGWSLEKRLRFSESHWSYLIGFGVPSTAVSFFHPSGLLNLMLFMLVFPICSVLALLADPQPQSTALGSQAAVLPTAPQADRSKELSLLLPARIPLFWPTVRFRRLLVAHVAPAISQYVPPAASSTPRKKYDQAGMPSSVPRRSAAQFVGGAWTSAPATPSPPVYEAPAQPAPWHASAVSIPMAADQSTLGARKFQKMA